MSTNGSTATDFSETAVAGAGLAGATVATVAAGRSVMTRFDSQNLSTTKYASATQRVTMIARLRRCPVCFLMDRLGSTSTVGFRPSGVISYTQAKISTAGKPTTISSTTVRPIHSGSASTCTNNPNGSKIGRAHV